MDAYADSLANKTQRNNNQVNQPPVQAHHANAYADSLANKHAQQMNAYADSLANKSRRIVDDPSRNNHSVPAPPPIQYPLVSSNYTRRSPSPPRNRGNAFGGRYH